MLHPLLAVVLSAALGAPEAIAPPPVPAAEQTLVPSAASLARHAAERGPIRHYLEQALAPATGAQAVATTRPLPGSRNYRQVLLALAVLAVVYLCLLFRLDWGA